MHHDHFERWTHGHVFLGENHTRNERKTWWVVVLTAAMMVVEIAGGWWFGSMALLADGWHMSTHAGAIGIAAFAYRYARHHATDDRYTFGTGKVGELAGFASAIVLAMVAVLIAYESVIRLFSPVAVNYTQATLIAVVGLGVNLLSVWLLDHHDDHSSHHDHAHSHEDHVHHHAHDTNLRAAYLHVVADALTSILAIFALLAGSYLGWTFLDPLMGIVGGAVILNWSVSLMRASSRVLLDAVPDDTLRDKILQKLEVNGDRVSDLHLWRLGPGHTGVIVAIVSERPLPAEHYKRALAEIVGLSHVTVETNTCDQGVLKAA